jgi:CheY-like chemotaxis protein
VPEEDRDEVVERFRRETKVVGRLRHPGIVTIYDYGEHEAVAWIAMEVVRGRTLREHLAGGYRAAADPLAPLVGELLEALDYAHASGVCHGDLRAENVMVTESGSVKLIGFRGGEDEKADLNAVAALLRETFTQPPAALGAAHASVRALLDALRPAKSGIMAKLGALRRAPQPAAPGASARRASVLFVDDEERVLNALRALFEDAYEVEAVRSCALGLERLRQRRFHVILAPEELLLEAKSAAPNAVRLLLTAHAGTGAGDTDAFRIVTKPWQQAELKGTLAAAADAAIAIEARSAIAR